MNGSTHPRAPGWLLAVLVAQALPAVAAAQTTSTWNGTAGNWTDAARWSTDPNFPNNGNGGVNYKAVVNGGTVTLNQDIAVSGFTMSGGSVASPGAGGPFTLAASGAVTLNGGTFGAGQTFQTGGAATITNNQSVPVMNGTWNNSGSITGASDNLGHGGSLSGSGVVNNLAGASYTFNGTSLLGPGTFNNFGTLTAATPGGTGFNFTSQWNFNNKAGGLVTGGNTTIQLFGTGTHDGTFNMTSAALQFEAGSNNTFTAGSAVTGSIDFYPFGGTVTVNGTFTPTGQTWVGTGAATATFNSAFGGTGGLRIDTGGVVNLNQPTTLTKLSLNNGGTLAGAGALTLNGTATNVSINGGTLAGSNPAAVQNTGTLAIAGTNQSNIAHSLTNASGGVINWSNIGPLALATGTTVTNSAGASFNATGHVDLYGQTTQSAGVFDNLGTFTKSSDSGGITIKSTFHNQAGATVNVQTGTLTIANPGTLAGTFNVSGGATLALSGTETLPGAATFAGAGTLAVGGGTATLTGTLTFPNFALAGGTLTGTGTLAAGTLTFSGGTLGRDLDANGTTNTFTGGTLTVGNGFTLTVPAGRTFQAAAGTIAGPGAVLSQGTFTKTGTGTLSVDAAFTTAAGAAVQVTGGTLQLNGPASLGAGGTVASGATLAFNANVSLPAGLAFAGAGTVKTIGGTTTLAGAVTIPNYTLAGGTLAGAGALTTANLTITGGTLGRDFAASGTTANTFAGGTLTVGGGFTFAVPAGATLQATAGTIAGPGAVANQGTLTKTGSGTVTITAPFTNAAGAAVSVQGGVLSLGGGSFDGNYTVAAGAFLDLAAGATVLSSAHITGGGKVTTSAANVTIASGGGNDYSGGTQVNSGGSLLVTGTGAALGTGGVTVAGGGTLRLSAAANLPAGTKADVRAGAVLGLESAFDPAPILTATSAGVLAIDGADFSTPLNMAALGGGQMFLGSATAGGYTAATLAPAAGNAVRLGGGGGTLTLTGTNVLTGAAAVTVGATGLTGTVRVAAANDYTGGTTLAAGTLAVGAAGALGSGPLTTTGGTLQADGGPVSVANTVTLGGNVTFAGADLLTLGGSVTLTGNRTVTVTGSGGAAIGGNISGDVLGRSLTKAGAGTLTLSGTNTFTGGITVNAGTLRTTGANQALGLGNVTVNSGAALRQAAFSNLGGGTSVRVNSGAAIGLDGNFPPSLDPASVGTVAINLSTYSQPLNQATMGGGQMFLGAQTAGQYNAATLGAGTGSAYRLGGAGGTLTIPNANVLTGFNSLLVGSTQVNGTGTVVLGASQDYQGNTTINAGSTLVLQASLTGPGTVFILPGATLAGSGFANGYVNLGGDVSPGFSPGLLTFTNGFGFGAGSHYKWELGALTTAGGGTAFDQVAVTSGVVTVDPAAVLNVQFTGTAAVPTGGDPFWQTAHSWRVVTLSGSAAGSGPLVFQIANAAWAAAGTFSTGAAAGGAGVDLVWAPAVIPAQAWTGAAGTSWNAGGNWNPATVPNSAATAITFAAAGVGPVNIASSVQAQSLTFVNATGAYTLTSAAGQTLSGVTAVTVAAGVTGTQMIDLAAVATGSLLFPAGGPLAITNNADPGVSPALVIGPNTVFGTAGVGGVTVTGGGFTRISGSFAAGAGAVSGGLSKTGAGRLELTGDNGNLTGPGGVGVTLAGGTLAVNADAALGAAGQAVKLDANSATAGGLEFLAGGVTVARPVTLSSTTRVVSNGADANAIAGVIGGSGQLVKAGTGTLFLTGANTYTGGTAVLAGTLAVAGDAATGPGPVTLGPSGTLSYAASTTTTRSFALAGGTLAVAGGQTVTLDGGTLSGGYLAGVGSFSTSPAAGARFAGATTRPSATIVSNSPSDLFNNFTNGGTLTVAAGPAGAVTLSGVTNQGSGTITVGAGSRVNAAEFQTYGLIDLLPGTSFGTRSQLTNTGTSPLFFNGGSRTFVGTVATAGGAGAVVDLNGRNATVAGGLFVNNGVVLDNSDGTFTGPGVLVADFGALIKGAGSYVNTPVTQNGGRFQAGNSPGRAGHGSLVLGPGGLKNDTFQINNATGTAGPTADSGGAVSGWTLHDVVPQIGSIATPGSFAWTADAAHRETLTLQSLLDPTPVGSDNFGPASNFDPSQSYAWPFVRWAGTYTGPTSDAALTASTVFDTAGFQNPTDGGTFGWHLDLPGQTLSLTFTPVPEPSTLGLAGLACATGLAGWLRRRQATSPHDPPPPRPGRLRRGRPRGGLVVVRHRPVRGGAGAGRDVAPQPECGGGGRPGFSSGSPVQREPIQLGPPTRCGVCSQFRHFRTVVVPGRVIALDGEESATRRVFLPLLHLLGRPNPGPTQFAALVTADELIIVNQDGTQQVWTKAVPK